MKIVTGEFTLKITRLTDKVNLDEEIQISLNGTGQINIYTQIGVIERVLAHLKEQEKEQVRKKV